MMKDNTNHTPQSTPIAMGVYDLDTLKAECETIGISPTRPTIRRMRRAIDREKAHRQYQALLQMKSVLPASAGKYPSFVEFCDFLQRRFVRYHWLGRKVKRIDIVSKPLHLAYVLIKEGTK